MLDVRSKPNIQWILEILIKKTNDSKWKMENEPKNNVKDYGKEPATMVETAEVELFLILLFSDFQL